MSYQKKVKLLPTKNYSFFLGRIYFISDDRLQNLFAYQTTFNVIKYLNASTEYITSWRSKGVYNTKIILIRNDSLPKKNILIKEYYYNLVILL